MAASKKIRCPKTGQHFTHVVDVGSTVLRNMSIFYGCQLTGICTDLSILYRFQTFILNSGTKFGNFLTRLEHSIVFSLGSTAHPTLPNRYDRTQVFIQRGTVMQFISDDLRRTTDDHPKGLGSHRDAMRRRSRLRLN